MCEIQIGVGGCSVSKVVTTLCDASTFNLFEEKLGDVARRLETDRELLRKLQRNLEKGSMSLSDAVDELVEEWVVRVAEQATINGLAEVLEKSGLPGCADALRKQFLKAITNEPETVSQNENDGISSKMEELDCEEPVGVSGSVTQGIKKVFKGSLWKKKTLAPVKSNPSELQETASMANTAATSHDNLTILGDSPADLESATDRQNENEGTLPKPKAEESQDEDSPAASSSVTHGIKKTFQRSLWKKKKSKSNQSNHTEQEGNPVTSATDDTSNEILPMSEYTTSAEEPELTSQKGDSESNVKEVQDEELACSPAQATQGIKKTLKQNFWKKKSSASAKSNFSEPESPVSTSMSTTSDSSTYPIPLSNDTSVNHPKNFAPMAVKKGYMKRKHELKAGGKETSLRSWELYYVVLFEGWLRFFDDQEAFQNNKEGASPRNVSGARCEVATDYVKRKNTFRLTLLDGSEFLFLEEGEKEMMEWIEIINLHATLAPDHQVRTGVGESLLSIAEGISNLADWKSIWKNIYGSIKESDSSSDENVDKRHNRSESGRRSPEASCNDYHDYGDGSHIDSNDYSTDDSSCGHDEEEYYARNYQHSS